MPIFKFTGFTGFTGLKARWILKSIPLLGLCFSVLIFQNCGRVNLSDQSTPAQESTATFSFSELNFLVDVNRSIVTDLNEDDNAGFEYSLSDNGFLASMSMEQGELKLNPDRPSQVTFIPKFGYRGTVRANLFITKNNGKVSVLQLVFEVRNPIRNISPSISVRAAECLLCHAQVKGDVISDFGYKSETDPDSEDWFLKALPNGDTLAFAPFHSSGNPHASGWRTAKIEGNIIVPEVNLSSMESQGERTYLISKDYIENGISKTAQTLLEYLTKVIFPEPDRVWELQTRKTIYIGAPQADDIRLHGRLDENQKFNFIHGFEGAPDLSGFGRVDQPGGTGSFYMNTDRMVCEGDIFVDGVVLLRNLFIETSKGCRIHATRSVFIVGPIEYIKESALTNIQIQSAFAVHMGGGICIDCRTFTGPNAANQSAAIYGTNFTRSRITGMLNWARFRHHRDNAAYLQHFDEDFAQISRSTPVPPRPADDVVDKEAYYRAAFEAAGIFLVDETSSYWDYSDISFRRILVNAPIVHSRYTGNFQGWVIAEMALWKLGQFAFKFEPVFTSVPIFPLVDISKTMVISED